MRAFAEKPRPARLPSTVFSPARRDARMVGRKAPCATCAPPQISFNFDRIPVYSPATPRRVAGVAPAVSRERGEAAGAPAAEREGWIGRNEVPVDFVGPLRPGDTRAVPHNFVGPLEPGVTTSNAFLPTISVVTPGRRTGDCGANEYKVRWGIPASEATSSGWIVQRVDETFNATDCAGNPVAPQPVDDPSGYPFWEAWEFTAGQNVWVGPAAGGTPHSGDTFGSGDYGPGTKGKATISGEVKAIVGFTLPAGMTVRNAMPAWSLPYTRTEPPQFASTLPGAAHTLTAEWNCCPRGTVTRRTSVTTNP
jgi:hypothetical protein